MPEDDVQFKAALAHWVASHDGDRPGVRLIEIDGHQCVVKRRHDTIWTRSTFFLRYLRSSISAVVCVLTLGEFPSVRVLLRNGLDDEASRLRELRAAGCRVPAILHHEPGVLVLEYVGQDLPYLIRIGSPADRLQWMAAAARDLARFHAGGFVHGGAQLRNLMWGGALARIDFEGDVGAALTRIDFEENIGAALSRPLGQAYDVYQMVSSMAGLRGHEFNPVNRQELCDALVHAYLEANPDPAVRFQLQRMAKALARVRRLLGGLLARAPGRDLQGVVHVADALAVMIDP